MAKKFWIVSYEFDDYSSARAFRDRNGIGGKICEGRRRSKAQPMAQTRLGRVVLEWMTPEVPVSIEDLGRVVESKGYSSSSVAAVMSKMAEQGDVLRVKVGWYVKRG